MYLPIISVSTSRVIFIVHSRTWQGLSVPWSTSAIANYTSLLRLYKSRLFIRTHVSLTSAMRTAGYCLIYRSTLCES